MALSPLTVHSELSFADIVNEKLIGSHRNSAVSYILERRARALGKTLNVGLRVSSFIAMAELVAQQLGIAVLPVNEVASSTLHSGVRVIPLAEPLGETGAACRRAGLRAGFAVGENLNRQPASGGAGCATRRRGRATLSLRDQAKQMQVGLAVAMTIFVAESMPVSLSTSNT